jgi:hypothetical protein
VHPGRDILIAAESTTVSQFLERCAQLFDRRLLLFRVARRDQQLRGWLQRCLWNTAVPDRRCRHLLRACVSPPLDAAHGDHTPARDRLVVAASDRLLALKIRPHGQLHELLRRRLQEAGDIASLVQFVEGNTLVPKPVADELRALGARAMVIAEPSPSQIVGAAPTGQPGRRVPSPVLALDALPLQDYLTHCTRRQPGPWPDQQLADYLDDLILGRADADHSPLATLRRIVTSQRLVASGLMIRGGTKVVSFTAVPLGGIGQLRTFRPHRGRWDFEPFGICIQRHWLQVRQTRPVRYGDESVWRQMPDSERPYFQVRRSGRRLSWDWSLEREWRHVGDLDLSELPAEAALLFVPTEDEARVLAAVSRWPVVIVGNEPTAGTAIS